jgi:hypothetical protein
MKGKAPSAQEFFTARRKPAISAGRPLDHEQYMDFAELYADFIVEFERRGGDLKRCEQWPDSRAGKLLDC